MGAAPGKYPLIATHTEASARQMPTASAPARDDRTARRGAVIVEGGGERVTHITPRSSPRRDILHLTGRYSNIADLLLLLCRPKQGGNPCPAQERSSEPSVLPWPAACQECKWEYVERRRAPRKPRRTQ